MHLDTDNNRKQSGMFSEHSASLSKSTTKPCNITQALKFRNLHDKEMDSDRERFTTHPVAKNPIFANKHI